MKKPIVFLLAVSTMFFGIASSFGQQPVSDEARRHFDRGMAAVEMAKSTPDYEDAIKEFEQAVRLAPGWPDVYYNLGLVQNKLERLDAALKNLRTYLQLAPTAPDVQAVKQLINKIEYRKEKADKSQALIKTLIAPGRLRRVSGAQQPTWPGEFRLTDGKLEAAVYLHSGKRWIPVSFDGKQLQCEFTWHHCSFSLNNGCPYKVKVTSEIISTSPLRLKNKAVWAQQFANHEVTEDEYILERVSAP
jgi:hypothetical protein